MRTKKLIIFMIVFSIIFLNSCYADDNKLINNIELSEKRNSYEILNSGEIKILYDGGQNTAIVPIDVGENFKLSDDSVSFYITDKKTAICYGGVNSPVRVIFSNDKGANWTSADIDAAESGNPYPFKNIGFSSPDDGWLVLGGGIGLGHQDNFIYETTDGGKTWFEIGNLTRIYNGLMTCAAFASTDIGVVCFRYYEDYISYMYRTEDRGKTWEKVNITLPDEYDKYKANITSIDFYGSKGEIHISLLKKDTGEIGGALVMSTRDFGKTWEIA